MEAQMRADAERMAQEREQELAKQAAESTDSEGLEDPVGSEDPEDSEK